MAPITDQLLKKVAIFATLFALAFLAAGTILYTHQSSHKKVTPETAAEIKGGVKTTTEIPEESSATTSSAYTESNIHAHLALNSANIIWFTNYERVKNNLKPLTVNSLLTLSSQRKNADMIRYNYFEHSRPGTPPTGFDYFIDASGYQFIQIAENLAMGDFANTQDLVNAWMRSETHRANILDPDYQEIGVALAFGSINGKENYLFVQHFGKPARSCPSVNVSLKELIETTRARVTELQNRALETKDKIDQLGDTTSDTGELIDRYNSFVVLYNDAVKNLSDYISSYNNQVRLFDACLRGE